MRTKSRCRCVAGLGLAGLVALPTLLSAADPAPKSKAPDPTRPYVLFMGADLAVQRDKRYYRVEDVIGSEFKISVGKKEFFVPTRNRATDIKVNNSLKLAVGSVKLDGLESGPSYTPANDPMLKFVAASGAAGGAAAVRDLSYGRMIQAEISLAAAGNALSRTPEGSASRGAVQGAFDAATREYAAGSRQAELGNEFTLSQQFDTTAYANQMAKEKAEGNFDAMEVSFKISSPVELDDPYMVILFRFHERDAKPGDESLLIHAKALDPIASKPKYIRIKEGGLPRGFKYVDSEVHIYNRGEEVATNASSRRVELTRAEAQQYLVIEHIGAHKAAVLPASFVPGTLPLVRRQQLSLDQLNRTFYAKVSPDGTLLGAYLDESCSQPLEDAGTLAALGDAFFRPALDKGKPVEGTARLRLADF